MTTQALEEPLNQRLEIDKIIIILSKRIINLLPESAVKIAARDIGNHINSILESNNFGRLMLLNDFNLNKLLDPLNTDKGKKSEKAYLMVKNDISKDELIGELESFVNDFLKYNDIQREKRSDSRYYQYDNKKLSNSVKEFESNDKEVDIEGFKTLFSSYGVNNIFDLLAVLKINESPKLLKKIHLLLIGDCEFSANYAKVYKEIADVLGWSTIKKEANLIFRQIGITSTSDIENYPYEDFLSKVLYKGLTGNELIRLSIGSPIVKGFLRFSYIRTKIDFFKKTDIVNKKNSTINEKLISALLVLKRYGINNVLDLLDFKNKKFEEEVDKGNNSDRVSNIEVSPMLAMLMRQGNIKTKQRIDYGIFSSFSSIIHFILGQKNTYLSNDNIIDAANILGFPLLEEEILTILEDKFKIESKDDFINKDINFFEGRFYKNLSWKDLFKIVLGGKRQIKKITPKHKKDFAEKIFGS